MPFASRKQWAWAYATHKKFAHKWAHETASYRRLPKKVRRKKK